MKSLSIQGKKPKIYTASELFECRASKTSMSREVPVSNDESSAWTPEMPLSRLWKAFGRDEVITCGEFLACQDPMSKRYVSDLSTIDGYEMYTNTILDTNQSRDDASIIRYLRLTRDPPQTPRQERSYPDPPHISTRFIDYTPPDDMNYCTSPVAFLNASESDSCDSDIQSQRDRHVREIQINNEMRNEKSGSKSVKSEYNPKHIVSAYANSNSTNSDCSLKKAKSVLSFAPVHSHGSNFVDEDRQNQSQNIAARSDIIIENEIESNNSITKRTKSDLPPPDKDRQKTASALSVAPLNTPANNFLDEVGQNQRQNIASEIRIEKEMERNKLTSKRSKSDLLTPPNATGSSVGSRRSMTTISTISFSHAGKDTTCNGSVRPLKKTVSNLSVAPRNSPANKCFDDDRQNQSQNIFSEITMETEMERNNKTSSKNTKADLPPPAKNATGSSVNTRRPMKTISTVSLSLAARDNYQVYQVESEYSLNMETIETQAILNNLDVILDGDKGCEPPDDYALRKARLEPPGMIRPSYSMTIEPQASASSNDMIIDSGAKVNANIVPDAINLSHVLARSPASVFGDGSSKKTLAALSANNQNDGAVLQREKPFVRRNFPTSPSRYRNSFTTQMRKHSPPAVIETSSIQQPSLTMGNQLNFEKRSESAVHLSYRTPSTQQLQPSTLKLCPDESRSAQARGGISVGDSNAATTANWLRDTIPLETNLEDEDADTNCACFSGIHGSRIRRTGSSDSLGSVGINLGTIFVVNDHSSATVTTIR